MKIVKEGATISNAELANNYWKKVVRIDDTIEINLDDFDAWYKAAYWRKEGGLIHYTSVSWYIKQWLDSAIFMSTDLEAK